VAFAVGLVAVMLHKFPRSWANPRRLVILRPWMVFSRPCFAGISGTGPAPRGAVIWAFFRRS
jgi:hypothetical protein